MGQSLKAIYLQDHLAGATAGHELAKRAARSNRGSELGEFLSRLEEEIGEDRRSLLEVMDELGVRSDPIKATFAWGAEKVGRLKPNGRILGYSPLSRVVELEGLHLGITGKHSLWQLLAAGDGEGISSVDLAELAARAERQLRELEPYRLSAAREAFESDSDN